MDLNLPELGEGVHEGELVKWLVKVGDTVKDDQHLCDIMTDKATMELPSPFSGTITSLGAKEGDTVKVGQVLLSYSGGAGAAKAAPAASAPAHSAPSPSAAAPAASSKSAPAVHAAPAPAPAMAAAPVASVASAGPSSGLNVLAAPSTRKFAREQGVDLAAIATAGVASGAHGRVMREDVDKWLNGGSGAVSAGPARGFVAGAGANHEERIAFKGLRKKISEKMRLSKDKAAHFTYVEECDATELVALRLAAKDIGAKQGIKVTFLPFVMKAMVAALKQYPILNSSLDEAKGEIVIKHYFNIGLSVQTDDGLSAPVIKNVESKSVLQLAKEIQDVVERARNKKLTLDDFSGGTITLTNAGSIGGLFATPVINFPEVAILGFNKIFRKPVVKVIKGKEEIVIRDWTYFSISLDHRIVDGAIGAEYMKTLIQYIENPSLMLLS